MTALGPDEQNRVSLLWPDGPRHESRGVQRLSSESAANVQLAEVVQALAGPVNRAYRRDVRERFAHQTLLQLCTDVNVIAYRQDVIADLLDDPSLIERLSQSLPSLEALWETAAPERYKPSGDAAQRLAARLADLEVFVDAARQLERALESARLRAEALHALRRYVLAITAAPAFQALESELPTLRATLAQIKSVTVGINLTADLLPESATILALNTERVEGRRTLLGRMLGGHDDNHGITPLQRGAAGAAGPHNELVRDLNRLLQDSAAPVADALERYAAVSTAVLGRVAPELALLLNGARLVQRLTQLGLPMCRPEILPSEDRAAEMCDAYNLALALRLRSSDPPPEVGNAHPPAGIVTNPVTFDQTRGRVWILTGPNRCGKTTYTRAVALAHILFQAGLYVPASSARISPVDAIYTHFPSVESARLGMGRLDEEAEQLAGIFRRATPNSLVLLNEALAGTSTLEALGLARGAVRGLRLLGARAVYVTHLHELAEAVAEINATTPGDGTVASLVGEVEEGDPGNGPRPRSFRIRPGAPLGRSYASDIAEEHGISFPQLARLLRQRGITSPAMDEKPRRHPDPPV